MNSPRDGRVINTALSNRNMRDSSESFSSESFFSQSFYPTTLDLAIMSKHSYKKENENQPLPNGFVKIFECKRKDGYKGAAFLHVEKKQLVIGHGGTEAIKDYLADLKGVGFQKPTSQVNSAYVFSAYVIKKYQDKVLSVSLTGHSLGGWLAQTTALYLKDCAIAEKDKIRKFQGLKIYDLEEGGKIDETRLHVILESVHVHVVSFDSPGCRHVLTGRYKTHRKCQAEAEDVIRKLDITIYLSHPNFVNSYAKHVGRLFSLYGLVQVKKKCSSIEWLKNIFKYCLATKYFVSAYECAKNFDYTKAVHCIDEIIETIKNLNDESANEILDWGHTLNSSVEFNEGRKSDNYEIYKANLEYLPLAIFDDEEYNFLLSISVLHKVKYRKFDDHKKIFEKIDDDKALKFEIPLESFDRTKIAFDIHILSEGLHPAKFVKYWKCWMIRYRSHVQYFKHPSYYVALYGKPAEYMQLAEMVVAPDSQNFLVTELINFSHGDEPTLVVKHDPNGNTFQATAQVYALVKKFTQADILCLNFKILAEMADNIDPHTKKNQISTMYIVEQQRVDEQQIIEQTDLSNKISEFDRSPNKKIIFVTKGAAKTNLSVDGQIQFHNLSSDGQSKVLNAKVNFQGSEVTLKQLVNNEDEDDTLDSEIFQKLVYNPEIFGNLLKNGAPKINIGQCVPNAASLLDAASKYMERTFSKNVLLLRNDNKNEKEMPSEYPGFYLITGNPPDDVAEQLKVHPDLVTSLETFPCNFATPPGKSVFVTSHTPDTLQKLESQKQNFHWFEYVTDKGFLWQASSLTDQRLPEEEQRLPKVKPSHDDYPEQVIINSSNRVIILGDEAGNGKTTMMFHFAQEVKKKNSNSWIIVTPLASISEQILEHFKGNVDPSSVAEFFARFDSPFSESKDVCSLQISILKNLLQQNDKVSFFFDGFDEIPSKVQSKVIDISKVIVHETNAKLRISSRIYAQTELEKALRTFAVRMNSLTEDEKVKFLCQFWLAQPECIELIGEGTTNIYEKVKNFANRILTHINYTINEEDISKVFGIPLMLFMAGTVLSKHFLDHITMNSSENVTQSEDVTPTEDVTPSEDVTLFTSITDLYKNFIKIFFDRALGKKIFQDSYLVWHHKAAFHYLSPSFIIDEEYKRAFELIPYIDGTMLAFLSQIGLLQAQKMNIKFLHRSIAEYFAAEYLVSNLNRRFKATRSSTLNFLKLNFFIPSFDKIRYFMDYMMAECMSGVEEENIFMDVLRGKDIGPLDDVVRKLSINLDKDLLDRIPLCYFITHYSMDNDTESNYVFNISEFDSQNIDSLGQYPFCYWSFANKDLMPWYFPENIKASEEFIWKLFSIATLRGDCEFLTRNWNDIVGYCERTKNEVKYAFDAIKLALYLKTQAHKDCIQFLMEKLGKALHDLSTYKYLIDDEYRLCSDNFMEYTEIGLEIFMWLCCREFCENKRLLKLLKKCYFIQTEIPDEAVFCFNDNHYPLFSNRTLQNTQFAHNLLKITEIREIIPLVITNQECSVLRLIQCALMSITTSEHRISNTSLALYFAFLTRIIALRRDQENEDFNLQVNNKLLPSFVWDIMSLDLYRGFADEFPFDYITFTIPFQDEDLPMQIKGKVEYRYEDLELSEFLRIYKKRDIDVYVNENESYRHREDPFANERRILCNQIVFCSVSYGARDNINLWISDKTGSSVKQFHTKDVTKLEGNEVLTDRFNDFDEALGEVLLNSAKFFAIRKPSLQSMTRFI